MVLIPEETSKHDHNALVIQALIQMFTQRGEVFRDKLGRNMAVGKQSEVVEYLNSHPAYLIWCDAKKTTLYGCLRLLPTTEPTLFYNVFRDTFPNNASLITSFIWEGAGSVLPMKRHSKMHAYPP